jgi:hypothetical protein
MVRGEWGARCIILTRNTLRELGYLDGPIHRRGAPQRTSKPRSRVDVVKGWGYPAIDFRCEAVAVPCSLTTRVSLRGMSAYVLLNAGPLRDASRLRVSLGAGVIRVHNEIESAAVPEVSVIGLEVGLERRLTRWLHADLSADGRAVVLPGVNGDRLWVLMIGVRARAL